MVKIDALTGSVIVKKIAFSVESDAVSIEVTKDNGDAVTLILNAPQTEALENALRILRREIERRAR